MNNASLDWAGYRLLQALPATLGSNIGAGLSGFGHRRSPGTCRRAAALFSAIRPEWAGDAVALDAALRHLWSCFGRNMAEVASTTRLVRQGRVVAENIVHVDDAMASGKPVILLFLHTGNFDVLGAHLAYRHPGRIFALYEPPSRASNAAIIRCERDRLPWQAVPVSDVVWRRVLRQLHDANALYISADELASDQVSAPFFGRPPRLDRNLGKVARLAMRTGALVVPVYSERQPGVRFTTHVLPAMRFDGSPAEDGDVFAAVEALDAVVTPPVIRLVDQWFMALHYRGFAASQASWATGPSSRVAPHFDAPETPAVRGS